MKRKFKIIFVIVAVMAMLFAFAISSSAELPNLGRTDDLYESSLGRNSNDYYIYNLVDDGRALFYFTTCDSSIYDSYGHYSLTIDEFNTLLTTGAGTEDLPTAFWNGSLVNYSQVLYYFEAGNTYESLGAIHTYGLFDGPYAIYNSLQNNKYTQSDLDNAVIEGKEAGVEEYKNSTEYKLELLEEVKKVTGGESYGVKVFGNFDFSIRPNKDFYEVVLPFGENGEKLLYIGANLDESNPALFISPSNLREFMSFKNLTSVDEFFTFVSEEYYNDLYLSSLNPNIDKEWFGNIGYIFNHCILSDGESEGYYYISAFADFFLEAFNYSEFTSDSLDAKYNEGVEAGKAEGKTEGYTEGFAEGMESFKESEAYANALQVQYATGKTDGVTEFKKSVAFKNTLKGEYDNGYDAGVADTEGQAVKNEFTKVLSIFIGVMGFGIILMAVLGVASKFKKKAKRR